MIFDFQASAFMLGENQIPVSTICEESGRDYSRTLARAGFEWVYRTDKSEVDFFSSFLSAHLFLNPGETVIFVNQSGASSVPGLAPRVFANLSGAENVNLIEISDGCSGFLRAFLVADSLLSSGSSKAVTIICGEIYSKFIDNYSTSAPIFSDAISQIRLTAGRGFSMRNYGVLNSFQDHEFISVVGGQKGPSFRMDGAKVLSWTSRSARKMATLLSAAEEDDLKGIATWFFHQGSKVVVESVAAALGAREGSYFSAGQIGNTSSSSIPIGLIQRQSTLNANDSIGLLAFGVGLSMIGLVLEADQ
jgi:3-oxoacyl-[acyl-carrier-protein] synthase-3